MRTTGRTFAAEVAAVSMAVGIAPAVAFAP